MLKNTLKPADDEVLKVGIFIGFWLGVLTCFIGYFLVLLFLAKVG